MYGPYQARVPKAKKPYKKKAYTKAYAPVPYSERVPYQITQDPRLDLKVWVHTNGGTVTSSPGTMVPLNGSNNMITLARGTSPLNQFTGRTIIPKSIEARFLVVGPQVNAANTAPDVYATVRVILFQWMDDSTPTVTGTPATDLLEPLTSANTAQQMMAPISSNNRSSIVVLMDKMVTTYLMTDIRGPLTGTYSDSSSTARSFKKYIKGRRCCPIEFASATAAYQKGGLYLGLISDSSSAPSPGVTWNIKVNFLE